MLVTLYTTSGLIYHSNNLTAGVRELKERAGDSANGLDTTKAPARREKNPPASQL